MERPRRLDGGSDGNSLLSFGDRDKHRRLNRFHNGFLQGTGFGGLSWDRLRGVTHGLFYHRFFFDGRGFDGLVHTRRGLLLHLGGGLGDDRFGLHRGLLFALLRFGLAFEVIQIAQ